MSSIPLQLHGTARQRSSNNSRCSELVTEVGASFPSACFSRKRKAVKLLLLIEDIEMKWDSSLIFLFLTREILQVFLWFSSCVEWKWSARPYRASRLAILLFGLVVPCSTHNRVASLPHLLSLAKIRSFEVTRHYSLSMRVCPVRGYVQLGRTRDRELRHRKWRTWRMKRVGRGVWKERRANNACDNMTTWHMMTYV